MPIRAEYRVIPEFPKYMINKDGVVRNAETGRMMSSERPDGLSVILRKDGKTYHRAVRTLLKQTFPELFIDPK